MLFQHLETNCKYNQQGEIPLVLPNRHNKLLYYQQIIVVGKTGSVTSLDSIVKMLQLKAQHIHKLRLSQLFGIRYYLIAAGCHCQAPPEITNCINAVEPLQMVGGVTISVGLE